MTRNTVLNESHRALGAKMVDFGGWDMPLNYGSQIEEHHAVRRAAGMFDVSHMTVVDLHGERVRDFLRHLLANDIDKLKVSGKALYSCMLNPDGGVIDDLIVYYIDEAFFRMVVNAATRDKDLAWITTQAQPFEVSVEERPELAMIAVQGPDARDKVLALLSPDARARIAKLGKFMAADGDGLYIARTGYTGEDGFEILVPEDKAVDLWQRLLDAGIRPCGLGARDSLRLEAGMNLYGQDMDETVSPWEAGLAWTVALRAGRAFVGQSALERDKMAGPARKMVGVVMDEKGVLRHGQRVVTDAGDGEILSGGFSPTAGKSIGFARVPAVAVEPFEVEIRGKCVAVRVVAIPFVKGGKAADGV